MERRKSLAYCGLDCADCYSYFRVIKCLAQDLRNVLDKKRFESAAAAAVILFEEFKHYKEFQQLLKAMDNLPCEKLAYKEEEILSVK